MDFNQNKRNRNLFYILLLLSLSYINGQTAFDRGYQLGYKKGYCYNKYSCLPPIPPLTPLPTIYEDHNSFEDGFLRGFLNGQNSNKNQFTNDDIYSQIDFKEINRDIGVRKYNKPKSSLNHELISQVLRYKQIQYEKKVKNLEKQKLNFKKKLDEFINHSYSLYKGLRELIEPISQAFGQINNLEIYLKNNPPQKIVRKYSNPLTKSDAENLVKELSNYNETINNWTTKVNEELQFFKENPNNIISGVYQANTIIDFRYNENTGDYEPYNEVLETSFIKFEENMIYFKRGDSKIIKHNALRYWGVKDNHYLFYDGRESLLAIDKDFSYIHWFYEDNLNGQFLKKAFYTGLKKL
ncbi:hypothetical protein ACSTS3_01320 [Aquimarina muelleri]|uniref:hypothetical protein n=1 Tax=Aquimarina muelleri TaxID=279356 RepID=UPI003F684D86